MRRLTFAFVVWVFVCSFWPGAASPADSPAVPAQLDSQVTLSVDLTASSSTLFSVPLDLGGLDVGTFLIKAGLSSRGVHGWDAQGQRYVPLKLLRPGQGFLLASGPGNLSLTGQRITAEAFDLFLYKGWNLIGLPYETTIPLASLQFTLDGKSENFPGALEKKWAGGASSLVNGKMSALNAETAVLEPWRGYWLYVYQPCKLTVFPPQTKADDHGESGSKPNKNPKKH